MKGHKFNFVGIGIFAVSLVFVATGVIKGDYKEILDNGVTLCLSCIGLGG